MKNSVKRNKQIGWKLIKPLTDSISVKWIGIIVIVCLYFITCVSVYSADTASRLTVYAFSAGAADAFLITTENSAVLIDCAEKDDGKDIAGYLKENGIACIDYLIITHFDKDHVGGAGKVISSVTVNHILQSDYPKESSVYDKYMDAISEAGIQAETITEDIVFELDGVQYRIDAPAGGYSSDESNNSSLIVSITNGNDKLLFMGDAEDERIKEYLDQNRDTYDFLKVPHHGRSSDMSAELISTVDPEIAVITSSGKDKEDKDVVHCLEQIGAEVYLTRKDPVVIESDGNSIRAWYETSGQ